MSCGCCCCCKNRGKVYGYAGPPSQQPVTVTAVITSQPAPAAAPSYPPAPVHYPNYQPAMYPTAMPQSREVPPPYSDVPPSAPGQSHSAHDYPQQNAYNPKY